MKYIKADSVLPIALVEELQSYIQGGYIYVPSRKDSKKKWGELSGCRYEIEQRNRKIRKDYQQGKSVDELADIYYLSVHSIRKSYMRNNFREVVVLRPLFCVSVYLKGSHGENSYR